MVLAEGVVAGSRRPLLTGSPLVVIPPIVSSPGRRMRHSRPPRRKSTLSPKPAVHLDRGRSRRRWPRRTVNVVPIAEIQHGLVDESAGRIGDEALPLGGRHLGCNRGPPSAARRIVDGVHPTRFAEKGHAVHLAEPRVQAQHTRLVDRLAWKRSPARCPASRPSSRTSKRRTLTGPPLPRVFVEFHLSTPSSGGLARPDFRAPDMINVRVGSAKRPQEHNHGKARSRSDTQRHGRDSAVGVIGAAGRGAPAKGLLLLRDPENGCARWPAVLRPSNYLRQGNEVLGLR